MRMRTSNPHRARVMRGCPQEQRWSDDGGTGAPGIQLAGGTLFIECKPLAGHLNSTRNCLCPACWSPHAAIKVQSAVAESYLEVQCWAVGAVEFPELTLNCLHRGLATSPVSAFTKSCATALDGVSGSNHLPRTRSRESQHAQGSDSRTR